MLKSSEVILVLSVMLLDLVLKVQLFLSGDDPALAVHLMADLQLTTLEVQGILWLSILQNDSI